MLNMFDSLFAFGFNISALSLLAAIINFARAFFEKDKDNALKLFKSGAICFFSFLLFFMVGFGACVNGI